MNNEHDNLGAPAEEIASLPAGAYYVEPSPKAWEDLFKLTRERDELWERVKFLETQGDVDLRRRLDAAAVTVEKLQVELEIARTREAAALESRALLVTEADETDKAFKAALSLIAHLSSGATK